MSDTEKKVLAALLGILFLLAAVRYFQQKASRVDLEVVGPGRTSGIIDSR